MKKMIQLTVVCLGLLMTNGCKENATHFDEYVYAVQLVDNPIKLQEYLKFHEKVWPEVEAGFKAAGYKSIRMYRFKNYVTMIIQVPKGTDLDKIGKTKELHTVRVTEWNAIMATYQKGIPGANEGATWVAMDKMYEFKSDN
ncbi:L-rhamnose mutarotase [Cellulophaga sp. F20128]|uniref:L-rhamnose mutarotase n=1 Tax=Cellulophaga sp. F20128 TaxID=2926413 RepID=UPI001FF3A6A5|nr:L-rhamnose mutarotase [Cellulophaga sp. F20128]MCK0156109.1 L-rhamnose mutarotase [Cellulophaga sp. F20128]